MRRHSLEDELVEFKPKRQSAVFGVRNGSYTAYVYYLGEPRGGYEHRYSVGLETHGEVLGGGQFTDDLKEAKEWARGRVKGRAFRAFMRRM